MIKFMFQKTTQAPVQRTDLQRVKTAGKRTDWTDTLIELRGNGDVNEGNFGWIKRVGQIQDIRSKQSKQYFDICILDLCSEKHIYGTQKKSVG